MSLINEIKQKWIDTHFVDRFHDQFSKEKVKKARLEATYSGDQVFHSQTIAEAANILKKEVRADVSPVAALAAAPGAGAGGPEIVLPQKPQAAAKKGARLFGLFSRAKKESESLVQKANPGAGNAPTQPSETNTFKKK